MARSRLHRHIDDAILSIAMQAAFLYARRRMRRAARRLTLAGLSVVGLGAGAIAAAAVLGWVAARWYRRRAKRADMLATSVAVPHPNGAGAATDLGAISTAN